MAKKVLVISTSIRSNSNSEKLAEAFADGAKAAGNEVELISLKNKTIAFCKGCLACQQTGHCVIKDDANAITAKMLEAAVVVWATPIYYYEMSGQMKTLLDRGNPLFVSDYRFRDVYLLSAAAEDEAFVPQRAESGLEGWVACFPKARLAGTVFGGGVTESGEMQSHPEKLRAAYDLGAGV